LADTNVSIVAGGMTFCFPSSNVTRILVKDIKEIPVPRESKGIDLNMAQDGYRLVGDWKDDSNSDYDGLVAFQRYVNFMDQVKTVGGKMTFSWSSGAVTETKTVMLRDAHIDKNSGEGQIMHYTITLAIVAST